MIREAAHESAGRNDKDGQFHRHALYTEAHGQNARVLPVPCDDSYAVSVNKWNYVVGYCLNDQTLPFLIHFPDLKLVDLRTQVVMPPGVMLTSALKINSVGMIVGGGSDGHFFLLIPSKPN